MSGQDPPYLGVYQGSQLGFGAITNGTCPWVGRIPNGNFVYFADSFLQYVRNPAPLFTVNGSGGCLSWRKLCKLISKPILHSINTPIEFHSLPWSPFWKPRDFCTLVSQRSAARDQEQDDKAIGDARHGTHQRQDDAVQGLDALEEAKDSWRIRSARARWKNRWTLWKPKGLTLW